MKTNKKKSNRKRKSTKKVAKSTIKSAKKAKAKSKSTARVRKAKGGKRSRASSNKARPSTLRQSKTDNFLENIRKNNSMIEYITNLRVMNPAANRAAPPSEKREGGFVRLAHARDEFPAPVLNKGKAFEARRREEAQKPTTDDKKTVSIDDKDE